MKFASVFTTLSVLGSAAVTASPVGQPQSAAVEKRNLPGLDGTQTARANAIIAENRKEGLGRQGCIVGITTAITESSVRILANNAVPASLNYPHDGLGSNYDSIGLFQQRPEWYPNIGCDMDAACSASQFYALMKGISGWQTMNVGDLCQAVQKSERPDAYDGHVALATQICNASGF